MKTLLTIWACLLGLFSLNAQNLPVFTAQAEDDANYFETIDNLPGDEYKDTAISELLIDGVGVH